VLNQDLWGNGGIAPRELSGQFHVPVALPSAPTS